MPAGQGNDAEQLAVAIDYGATPDSVADAELARDLEIVAMLRTRGAEHGPRPDARAAAKQRLMQALLAQQAAERNAPPAIPAPAPAEVTARLGGFALIGSDDPQSATTAVMDRISDATSVLPPASADDRSGDRAGDRSAFPGGGSTARVLVGPDTGSTDGTGPRTRRADRSHGRSSRPGSRRADRGGSGMPKRMLLVGAAALVALIAITGTGTFASRDALPGDALYAVKRLSEDTGTALTFDGQALAQRYLALATTRLDEAESLAGRGTPDAALVESAMADFDGAATSGAQQLLGGQVPPSDAELGDLAAWAGEQSARLSVLRSAVPTDAVPALDDSADLLDRILERAEAFGARSGCDEVASAVSDDLGRLPAVGTCVPTVASVPVAPELEPGAVVTTEPGADPAPTGGPSNRSTSGPTPSPRTSTPQDDPTTPQDESSEPLLPLDQLPLLGGDDEESGSTGSGDDGDGDSDGSDGGGGGGGGGQVSVPLPLLPPVELPPLLPGLPGVSIG